MKLVVGIYSFLRGTGLKDCSYPPVSDGNPKMHQNRVRPALCQGACLLWRAGWTGFDFGVAQKESYSIPYGGPNSLCAIRMVPQVVAFGDPRMGRIYAFPSNYPPTDPINDVNKPLTPFRSSFVCPG